MTVFLPLMFAAQMAGQQPVSAPSGQTPPAIAVQQPSPAPFKGRDSQMPQLQGFNIVLLVGESQSSGASIEDVPAAARKALADMRDFLPFKHYRVLDTQWTSCCAESGRNTIAGRVQGVAAGSGGQGTADVRLLPRTYNFILQVGPNASRLSVYFSLQPEGSMRSGQNVVSAVREQELEKRLFDLRRELDQLEDEIPRRTKDRSASHPEVQTLQAQQRRVQQRIAETVNEISSSKSHNADTDRSVRSLIDSNFTMDVGETVVVGTSRLGGDKALIAIVTAARKTTAR